MSADTPPEDQRENPGGRRLGNDRRWSSGPPPDGEDRRTEEDRRGGARREEEAAGGFPIMNALWGLVAAFVLVYLVLLAFGAVTVDGQPALGVVALVLGLTGLFQGARTFFRSTRKDVRQP